MYIHKVYIYKKRRRERKLKGIKREREEKKEDKAKMCVCGGREGGRNDRDWGRLI